MVVFFSAYIRKIISALYFLMKGNMFFDEQNKVRMFFSRKNTMYLCDIFCHLNEIH